MKTRKMMVNGKLRKVSNPVYFAQKRAEKRSRMVAGDDGTLLSRYQQKKRGMREPGPAGGPPWWMGQTLDREALLPAILGLTWDHWKGRD